MIQAIIFDFDGLILDTETPDCQSWREVYESFGYELPLDLWKDNIGSAELFDPYLYLEEQMGRPVDRQAVRAQRRQRDDELLAAQRTLPGVETYLNEARQLGLKVGLASSSRHEWVDTHLTRLALFDHFDAICCRDDVENRSKPDPAVYRAALDALDVEARNALALEDSPNGVLAAKRAGLICAAVPNQMTRGMSFDGADYQLNSLADLPLVQLITEAGG
jgi:HAD superfamily hydrolase (TIGR01509 family)